MSFIVSWKGKNVVLYGNFLDKNPCKEKDHELEVLHHTDNFGTHFCPSGFIWCVKCLSMGDEPEPFECSVWGIKPEDRNKLLLEKLKEKHGAFFQIDEKVYFYSITEAKKFMDDLKLYDMTKNSWPTPENAFTAYMYTVSIKREFLT